MLPLPLLQSLTPIAAKLYLILLASADPPTHITLTINQLAQRAAISPRSCAYALRQLQNLHLIHRLPTARHTFTLQPVAALQPAAVSTLQPAAPSPAKTPIPSPKTTILQPAALSLNPADLALLRTYMHSLPTAQQSQLIAQAHAVLARLNTQEAHP